MKTSSKELSFRQLDFLIKKTFANTILRNAILVAGLIGFAKAISLIKEVLVAEKIGVSPNLDAFIMANTVIGFYGLIVSSTYSESMLPEFVKIEENEPRKLNQYFSNLLWIGAIGFTIGLFLLVISSSYYLPFFTKNFDHHTIQQTTKYFYFLLPSLVFGYFTAMFLKVLNAKKKNILISIKPLFISGLTILFFFTLNAHHQTLNLILGLNFGTLILLILSYRRISQLGIRLQFHLHYTPEVARTIRQFLPYAFSMFLIALKSILDNTMTAHLGIGNVSLLSYSFKVYSMIAIIPCTVISIILFPYFSKLIAQQNITLLKNQVKKIGLTISVISIAVVSLLILNSRTIVALLFERGAFQSTDTIEVATIFSMYSLGLPFDVLGILGIKLISAFQLNKVLIWSALIGVFANAFFNIVFMKYFQTAGIALATSVVFFIILIFYSIILKRHFTKMSITHE